MPNASWTYMMRFTLPSTCRPGKGWVRRRSPGKLRQAKGNLAGGLGRRLPYVKEKGCPEAWGCPNWNALPVASVSTWMSFSFSCRGE